MTLDWITGLSILILKLAIVLVAVLVLAAYLVLFERKLLARLQVRLGPNRVGPFGLLQPLADAIKLMLKEDTVPAAADRPIFLFAPAVVGTTPRQI
jgi:NADH-quinone oxidoreductase subunit H